MIFRLSLILGIPFLSISVATAAEPEKTGKPASGCDLIKHVQKEMLQEFQAGKLPQEKLSAVLLSVGVAGRMGPADKECLWSHAIELAGQYGKSAKKIEDKKVARSTILELVSIIDRSNEFASPVKDKLKASGQVQLKELGSE